MATWMGFIHQWEHSMMKDNSTEPVISAFDETSSSTAMETQSPSLPNLMNNHEAVRTQLISSHVNRHPDSKTVSHHH